MSRKNNDLNRREELISLAKRFEQYFTTIAQWNEFASKRHLPSSEAYKWEFGTWNNAKKEIGISVTRTLPRAQYQFTTEELIEIIKKHGQYMHTLNQWNEYAKANDLPKGMTFIKFFGTWDQVKQKREELGIELLPLSKERGGKYSDYTDEDLIRIAQNHIEAFTSQETWNNYADEHGLPLAWLYKIYFGSWKEAKEKIGAPSKKELLEQTAIQNEDVFMNSKAAEWDRYARKNHLPLSRKFTYAFGSWDKAKEHIANLNEPLHLNHRF